MRRAVDNAGRQCCASALTRQWCLRMSSEKRTPQHPQFSTSSSEIHTPASDVFLPVRVVTRVEHGESCWQRLTVVCQCGPSSMRRPAGERTRARPARRTVLAVRQRAREVHSGTAVRPYYSGRGRRLRRKSTGDHSDIADGDAVADPLHALAYERRKSIRRRSVRARTLARARTTVGCVWASAVLRAARGAQLGGAASTRPRRVRRHRRVWK